MKGIIGCTLFVGVASILMISACFGVTIHVPGDYPSIQPAIDHALDGDTVLVANGTYTGADNKNIDYLGKAIVVISENGAPSTVIDCEGDGRGFYFYRDEGPESGLNGFTIRNGYVDNHGGGILCDTSSPTITNCRIISNTAWGDDAGGGGICCLHASPNIMYCMIMSNTSEWDAGGIFCEFSSASIDSCIISGNTATSDGGGIYCRYYSFATVTNCLISENTAGSGGGLGSHYNSSTTVANCTITGNTATGNRGGGGIYINWASPTIRNCAILRNNSFGYFTQGGGICCDHGSFPTITNCTIAENWSEDEGGGIHCDESYPTVTNCIVWDNSPDEIGIDYSGKPIVTYSDVKGSWAGEGNMDSDPLFVDPEGDDFTLQEDSPCVDAGDPYSRFDNDASTNDVGAFGGTGEFPPGVIGGILSGTLSVEGSPYIVSESLIIESGSVLAIDAGVTLQLHNHSGLVVYGDVRARGLPNLRIMITRLQEWDRGGGIRFENGQGELSFCQVEYCISESGTVCCANNSAPLIDHCIITKSKAGHHGGGISCEYFSSPTITHCMITENTSDIGGGIVCSGYFGVSNPTITGCTISGNTAERGGGIYCFEAHPVIEDCVITENTVEEGGGGIYCSDASPTIRKCTITGNTTDLRGGGGIHCLFSSLGIANCAISGNAAGWSGGGIYCSSSSLTVRNCILWGDSPQEIYVIHSGSVTSTYSDIQGGWSGYGNIDEDPRFIRFPVHGFEYLLHPDSPCIDAGDPAIGDALYDWHPRWPDWYPDGARSDMGAYGGYGNFRWL